jgi:hypothetical protein
MKLWAYCDNCKETRLVNGAEIESLLKDGKPGEMGRYDMPDLLLDNCDDHGGF